MWFTNRPRALERLKNNIYNTRSAYNLKVCRSGGNFLLRKNTPKKTNMIHIDASSLLIGPMPVQSSLMGSKQHDSSFCKPNQCCPFLHSLAPLVVVRSGIPAAFYGILDVCRTRLWLWQNRQNRQNRQHHLGVCTTRLWLQGDRAMEALAASSMLPGPSVPPQPRLAAAVMQLTQTYGLSKLFSTDIYVL